MSSEERSRKTTPRPKNPHFSPASPWMQSHPLPGNDSAEVSVAELVQQLSLSVCQALDCEAGAVLLLNSQAQGELWVKKVHGKAAVRVQTVELDWSGGLLEKCIQQKQAARYDNPLVIQAGFTSILSPWKVTSLVCAPLATEEQVLGAVVGCNKVSGAFTLSDQIVLANMAFPITHAVVNLQRVQHIKNSSMLLESGVSQLTRSRDTLRALFDSIPISIYIVDSNFNLISVNQARAERVNRTPNLLVGQPCYQALFQREEACPGCRVLETLATGKNTVRTQRRSIRHLDAPEHSVRDDAERVTGRGRNDEVEEWEISTYPISDDQALVGQVILVEQDVTEKHRLEAIVAQSEKLAAIGQLAAGVAHEINNPLTAILANAQMLQRELHPNDDKQELVSLIAKAGARAAQVVRSLLDLARQEQYEFLPTDVNETVRKALELVRHEIVSHSIALSLDLPEDLPLIRASQNHLHGIWVNLLVNAVDAVEEQTSSGDVREIKVATRYASSEVHISITDTGKGIPPERLQRIFDPFYTTKIAGRGTGLGLAVCDRIVKHHGGHIRVKSQLGVGTEFTVILPVGL